MICKPANPKIWHRQGLPAAWFLTNRPGPTFAGNAGDVADLTRGVAAGTRAAGCTWAADAPDGPWLAFSGSGTGVTLTAPRLLALPAFSVAVTVRFDSLAGTPTVYAETTSGAPVLFIRASSGVLQWWVFNGAFTQTNGPTLSAGVVYRVVGTYQAGVGPRLYLNGSLVASAADGGHGTSDGGPFFGSRGSGLDPLTGRAGNLQIYTRALPAAEVAQDNARPLWRLQPPSDAWLYGAQPAGVLFRRNLYDRTGSRGVA